jgi:hypothetical protein
MSREDSGKVIREVSAHRLSTADAAQHAVQETVSVVLEAPVTIDIERIESYTLLCTPDDNLALATGFLLSEGIVDSLDDVASLELYRRRRPQPPDRLFLWVVRRRGARRKASGATRGRRFAESRQ